MQEFAKAALNSPFAHIWKEFTRRFWQIKQFLFAAACLFRYLQQQILKRNTMNERQTIKISKFLSLVLRHEPDTIGITLDENGWTSVPSLIAKLGPNFPGFNMAMLEEVVSTNSKKRFSFNGDKTMIRANQGHSVEVDLDYEPVLPPEILYHGTVDEFIQAIEQEGLQKMSRHHVHMSQDQATAITVAIRRGKALILKVKAGEMHRDGFDFFRTPNGVWLTDHVPAKYLIFP
jgi:putative RNA 2'-phosphotransferase